MLNLIEKLHTLMVDGSIRIWHYIGKKEEQFEYEFEGKSYFFNSLEEMISEAYSRIDPLSKELPKDKPIYQPPKPIPPKIFKEKPMRHILKECSHCRIRYSFQASREGSSQYNDDQYCKDCKKVIVDALKKIPIRAKKIFVPSDDLTEAEFKEKLNSINGFHRVWAGLYDNDGDYRCYHDLNFNGKLYQGSWWTNKGEFELKVEKYVEL